MAEGTLPQFEHAAPAAGGGGWPVVASLAWRELVRFARQRNRVFGAIGQPILFWILFGAGLGTSFRMPGAGDSYSYSEYFFPGAMTLILLFTAIFATISIIEDRREGFLQGVLVAPISRTAMVLGKVLGGTLIALAQGLVFLVLGLTIGLQFHIGGLLAITAFCFLLAFALTALGFVIAWRMDSTQGFHAVMSVFLMPMWLLSGAFFPAGDGWLGWIMAVNPLTYGVAGLRRLLYWNTSNGADAAWLDTLPSMATCLTVTVLFAAVAFALSCWIAGQHAWRLAMSMAVRVWMSVILLLLGVYAAYGGYRAYVKVAEQTEPTPTLERRVVPDGTLVDTAGEPFDMKSLAGKPWVGSFFFASCPGPCAEMNRAIAKLQQDLPDNDVPFISITVDPTNDTPERLARYSEGFGADPKRWKFLTGPLDYIKHLGQDMFKVAVGPQTHAKTVMLVDGDGQVLGSYDATMPAEMLTLKRQLEKLGGEPESDSGEQPSSDDGEPSQADEAQT